MLRLSHSTRRLFSTTNIIEELTTRGLIADVTRPEKLSEALKTKQSIYSGIDPTAQSLHVGHLLPMITLLHFQIRGHQIMPLIGGATGLIGDPSGRSTERTPAIPQTVHQNVTKLKQNVSSFFQRAQHYIKARSINQDEPVLKDVLEPRVMDNLEWFRDMGLLEFLRVVGVNARVNTMLNRESVQTRMTTHNGGISYTEFSYQLLQAFDFYTLHTRYGCSIQVGGSDQWGNIVAGLDLIARMRVGAGAGAGAGAAEGAGDTAETGVGGAGPPPTPDAFGITTPLLTTPSGQKFGKSAGNAVWLDESLTSVFDFYQFFLRTPDADVSRYLKMFTLLPVGEVEAVMRRHLETPEKRLAQRLLADEVTELVHGKPSLHKAHTATTLLFSTSHAHLTTASVLSALSGDPRLRLLDNTNDHALLSMPVVRVAAKYGLVGSISAARTLLQSHGLYLNNKPLTDPHATITPADLIDGRIVILRAGKDKHLVLVLGEGE